MFPLCLVPLSATLSPLSSLCTTIQWTQLDSCSEHYNETVDKMLESKESYIYETWFHSSPIFTQAFYQGNYSFA